jgi:hypothetical protein
MRSSFQVIKINAYEGLRGIYLYLFEFEFETSENNNSGY